MRRWLMIAALALFACGCKSFSDPNESRPKKEQPTEVTSLPNGESTPFTP